MVGTVNGGGVIGNNTCPEKLKADASYRTLKPRVSESLSLSLCQTKT